MREGLQRDIRPAFHRLDRPYTSFFPPTSLFSFAMASVSLILYITINLLL